MTLTYISKENSLLLKGLALLFMVYYHLFLGAENLDGAFSLCSVQGLPLATWLARGCNPVGIYLFISGYGLYFTHRNNAPNRPWTRIFKLYKLYWLTLVVFLPLACWMSPDVYPGDWLKSLQSITAFRTRWNGEIWFLFPYILLVLTNRHVFSLLDRVGGGKMVASAYMLYIISAFLISRYYGAFFADHYTIYHVALYFSCLFPFVMGAVFCKYADRECPQWLARLLPKSQPGWVLLFVLVFLFGCLTHWAPLGPFCQFAMIVCFVRIKWFEGIKKVLRLFGRYSTVVWFIHTWFCSYLFKEYIYGLHYPLLMLVATMGASIAVGYFILKVDKWTTRLLGLDARRKSH